MRKRDSEALALIVRLPAEGNSIRVTTRSGTSSTDPALGRRVPNRRLFEAPVASTRSLRADSGWVRRYRGRAQA